MKGIKHLLLPALIVAMLALGSCQSTDTKTTSPTNTATATASKYTNLASAATATAVQSAEGYDPAKAIDADKTTYWQSKGLAFITFDFGSVQKLNTIKVTYSGDLPLWDIRCYNDATQKWTDVLGTVMKYQTNVENATTVTFQIDDLSTSKLMLNVDEYNTPVKLYDFEVYYIPGQDPIDSRNYYVTTLHTNLLEKIGAGNAGAFDVFPASDYVVADYSGWKTEVISDRAKVSFDNSKWAKSLDEIKVFNKQISHTQGDGSKDWTIRVGNGGQIYSFMTPVGELIPPQTKSAEWMDEVWQVVSIASTRRLSDTDTVATHYIHQAGMYIGNDNEKLKLMKDTFYSPRLAEKWNSETRTLSTLNLGMLSCAPNLWRSNTQVYTNIRDIGDGMIEMTYGVANYGGDILDIFNFPWGGARKTTFPDMIMSYDDGTYGDWYKSLDERNEVISFKKTGGWMAFTQDSSNPDSYTVAWVLGRDDTSDSTVTGGKQRSPSIIQAFDAVRDSYNCACTIESFRVAKNDMFYCRIYVITGKLSEVAKKAGEMTKYVKRGYITLNDENASYLRGIYQTTDQQTGKTVWLPEGQGDPLFYVYNRHITGSRPLYLLYDNVKQEFVASTDPYICGTERPLKDLVDVTQRLYKKYAENTIVVPYDGNTDYIGILGYVMTDEFAKTGNYVPLSSIGGLFRGTGADDASIKVIKTK